MIAKIAAILVGCTSDGLEEKGFRVDNTGMQQCDSLHRKLQF